jgi:hypothetical protein
MSDEEDKTPQQARQDIINAALGLRAIFEAQNELYVEQSKLLRARYESLLAVGFTDVQAMQFITARGLQ